MLPTVVPVQRKGDLRERTPLRTLRFLHQMHSGLLWRPVCFLGIALDTGADDVLPGRRATPVPGNHVVEVQVFSVERPPAVLARILVTLKNVVTRELHFLFREMIVNQQEDYPGQPDPKCDAAYALVVWLLDGDMAPLIEIESLKAPVVPFQHRLRVSLEKERQRPAHGADVNRLPQPIQYQNVLIEQGTHTGPDLRPSYTSSLWLSTNPRRAAVSAAARQKDLRS